MTLKPLPLSRTEIGLVRWIAEGRTNPWIAGQLCTTTNVAKHLVDRVLTRANARNRAHLVALAFAAGQLWFDLDGEIQTRTSTAARLDAIHPHDLGGAS